MTNLLYTGRLLFYQLLAFCPKNLFHPIFKMCIFKLKESFAVAVHWFNIHSLWLVVAEPPLVHYLLDHWVPWSVRMLLHEHTPRRESCQPCQFLQCKIAVRIWINTTICSIVIDHIHQPHLRLKCNTESVVEGTNQVQHCALIGLCWPPAISKPVLRDECVARVDKAILSSLWIVWPCSTFLLHDFKHWAHLAQYTLGNIGVGNYYKNVSLSLQIDKHGSIFADQ